MLALSLYELGDERAAVENARRAVELDPDYDLGLVFLASIAYRRGHYAEALRRAEQALAHGGRPAVAHLIAGKTLARSDRPNVAGALWHLERSMEAGQEDPEGLFLYARLVLVMNRAEPIAVREETSRVFLSRAKALIRERLLENPEDADLHLFLAQCELATGRHAAARDHLQRSISLSKWLPGQRVLKARLEWENGNPAESRRLLDEVLAGSPDVGILTEIIEFYRMHNQAGEAADALKAAQRLRPEDPDIQAFVALDLMTRKNVEGAILILRPLSRQHPEDPRFVVLLARSLSALGRQAEAEKALRRELTHPVPAPLVLLALADLLLDTTPDRPEAAARIVEARALIDTVLTQKELREPLGHHLALLQGKSELRRRRFAPAREHLERAIQLNSSSAEAHFLLAQTEEALGDFYEASKSIGATLRLSGESPKLLARRVELLLRLGQRYQARSRHYAEQAYAEYPEDEAVVIALAKVRARAVRAELGPALALLTTAMSLPGASAQPALTMAGLVAGRGDFQRAEGLLVQALPLLRSPEDRVLATDILGQLLGRRGTSGSARQAFEVFLADHPEDTRTPSRYASLLLERGDLREAGRLAERILIHRSRDPAARLILFEISLLRSVDAAREHLDATREGDPENPAIAYREGRLALLAGRPEEAVSHFERAREAAPRDPRVSFFLADARFRSGDLHGARAAAEHALRRRSRFEQARLLLAEISYREARQALLEGSIPDAVVKLQNTLAADPGRASARALLAATTYRLGLTGIPGSMAVAERQCVALIEDLEQNDASTDVLGRAWLLLAGIRLATEDREGLLVACSRYHELYPHDTAAILRKASALLANDLPGAAMKLLREARAAAPTEWLLVEALVDVHLRSGDPTAAQQVLREWIAGNPRDANAHFRLGRVLARAAAAETAEREYRAALRIEPRFAAAATALANLLLGSGKREAALNLAREFRENTEGSPESALLLSQVLLSIDLTDAEGIDLLEASLRSGLPTAESQAYGFVVLLRTLFSTGRTADAVAAAHKFGEWARGQVGMREGSALAALLAEGYCISGAIHHHDGDLELARNRYLRAIEQRRDYALALNNLAALTLEEPVGRTASGVREALLLAERAVEIDPRAPEYHDTYGFALAAAGRPEEAIKAYSEAIRILRQRLADPSAAKNSFLRRSLAESLVRLAISQRVTGKEDEARETLEQATVADPAVVGKALYVEALNASR